ncbi:TIGR01777 family oxidoreductase [Gilvimarinus polysaccharolyticus]|uniref:TIGR01777 family oxidoreductase n=1 Tax=Gilvimarinus polysaccharolyticus TaxID=863921 RepID=UPI000673303E|nr:TIGR01777 family oxidoreductase [Gilvimarinus polysaccharolyticus]
MGAIDLPQSNILVTGGTGFIGQALCRSLSQAGAKVTVVTRDREKAERKLYSLDVSLTDFTDLSSCAGFDAVINLAGAAVLGRWGVSRRQTIRDSRIAFTQKLMAQLAVQSPPKVFVSGSAVGYYGDTAEVEADEHGSQGVGFAADLCCDWERQAMLFSERGSRVCLLRAGVVLAQGGGALGSMLPAFKLGLGGPIAGGEQWMSWIHRQDLVSMIIWLLGQDDIAGPINAVAPNPVRNREFSRQLAEVLNRPAFLNAPRWLLNILLGQAAQELLLNSNKVVPRIALGGGFVYRYPQLLEALKASV